MSDQVSVVVSSKFILEGDRNESDDSGLGGLYLLFSTRDSDCVAILGLVSSRELDVDVEVALNLQN